MEKYFFLLMLIASLKSSAQTDCSSALSVCGNTSFENVSLSGFGGQEIASCGSEEHNSLWLKIHIVTSGTLAFNIIPESTDINEDFDFFLFRYNQSCDNLGQVRCSTTNPAAAGLTSNVTGTSDAAFDAFEGPGPSGNGFVQSVDVVAGQTYMLVIDRPHGNSNFSLEWTGTAEFNDPPTLDLPPDITTLDIRKCDADGIQDGVTQFDLTQNTPLILGNQTAVTVGYYNTSGDCVLGVNAIQEPQAYFNMADPETIYVRVTNALTGCFITAEFEIGLNNEVALAEDQYTICDDANDGNAANGQALFDLQSVTQAILPGFAEQGFSVQYFLTEQDALNSVSPLAASFYNTVPGQQTIYVKADAGFCSSIKPVKLTVRSFSAIPPATLIQCDYGMLDGITVFDLTQADDSFTAADPNLSVRYFEDAAALSADTPLPSIYANVSNPQTVIALVTDNVLGCSVENALILNVNSVAPQSIAPLSACDMSGNGFAPFDLTDADVTVAPQTAAFYPSLQDALLQQNQIVNVTGYTNPTAYQSSVFVRIDDAVSGCAGISEIQLRVNPLPVIQPTGEAHICINQPGFTVAVNAGQLPPGAFSYAWTFNNTALPDTTYTINAAQPGTYAVAITNANGCTRTRTVTVLPSDVPMIQSVDIYGNSVTLNLGAPNTGYSFSIDQPNGPFQQSNYFTGLPCGPHTAYVDGGNGCGTTLFRFEIMLIPAYFSPNGDGFADRWNMQCGENHPNTRFYIFDRFGKLLAQIGAAGSGWDGNYNGRPLPSDDYWYIMEADDGTAAKGHFALKR